MGAREDFMVVRRAAGSAEREALVVGSGGAMFEALAVLLRKAGTREAGFIRLEKAGIQGEVIDLAYAILGETRPEGPAAPQPIDM